MASRLAICSRADSGRAWKTSDTLRGWVIRSSTTRLMRSNSDSVGRARRGAGPLSTAVGAATAPVPFGATQVPCSLPISVRAACPGSGHSHIPLNYTREGRREVRKPETRTVKAGRAAVSRNRGMVRVTAGLGAGVLDRRALVVMHALQGRGGGA